MINLPKEYKIFTNTVIERSRDLIDLKIWEGIDIIQFDKWLQNFKGEEEKYFSACLLDSLIYRSDRQTSSLIFDLMYNILPNELRRSNSDYVKHHQFPNCVQSNKEPAIRFVATIKPNDSPTKSSMVVLRHMKRNFNVSENWIINPNQIKNDYRCGIRNFIFIDDFVGTGQQFNEVVDEWEMSTLFKDCYLLYAPLVAHQVGIDRIIRHNSSMVKVVCSDLLDERHSFFESYFDTDGNTPEGARQFYKKMFSSRNINLSKSKLFGWGNLELTYSFAHATPDNSLPVFFHKENWEPLVNR